MSSDPPIHDVKDKLPRPYHSVRVFFADGTKTRAVWTGKVWWSHGELHPVSWQEMDFMRVGLADDEE